MSESYVRSEKESNLTQERLQELLDYNPETGAFTHKASRNRRIHAGQKAGYLDKRVGYVVIGADREIYQAHRLAWLFVHGEFPDAFIDHINGIRSDNRMANLRVATRSQNGANQRRHRDNRTGFKGVRKYRSKYVAQIKVAGRMKHIGSFTTPEEAAKAYQGFAARVWGEYAAGETA